MKNIFMKSRITKTFNARVLAAAIALCSLAADSYAVEKSEYVNCADKTAKAVPDGFSKSVIYQMFLRMCTPEGTLKAGERLLPHVASLGVDIVYICPVVLADDDGDKNFWSGRQKAFGQNPKNPYRQKDYFEIDPEYGTAQDLKDFVATAHKLGMKVMYDLVYFHCGPKANLIKEHPDFVKRNPDGSVKVGEWKFPQLDFDNQNLREYLWKNMEYLVSEYDFDGYRTDVADLIPISFWNEGAKRIRKIKPDFIFLNEGVRPKDHLEAFDASYGFYWLWALRDVFEKGKSAEAIFAAEKKSLQRFPKDALFLRCRENHDMAMDAKDNRPDKKVGHDGAETMLFLNFTIDGVALIYNGNEVGDSALHSIFSNRFHGRLGVDWSLALTDAGRKRMAFVKKLAELKHTMPALAERSSLWLENSAPEKVVSFARVAKKQTLLVVANTKNEAVDVDVDFAAKGFAPLIAERAQWSYADGKLSLKLSPYGFVLLESK